MDQSSGKTHAKRAVIELRKKILSGDIPGGTRLFEVPLAEDLKISRTPVREAMSRLAEEGLLDRASSGGFVVRTFGFADVVDAIELRGVLEGTAARLAAERGVSPEALGRMRKLLEGLDGCFGEAADDLDFDTYSELNAEFHHELAGLSGSEIVRREVERVMHLPFASPSAFMPNMSDITAFRRSLRTAQDQHHVIVSAIADREGARAEAVTREHARMARRNLDYVLVEGQDLIERISSLALVVD